MTAPAVTKGVLLDIDGTLLDSNDAHAMSWVDALEEHGLHGLAVTFERVRPLIGMGGDKLLAKIAKIDHESKEGEAISKRRRAIFETRYLPRLVPFEGARALLERVRAEGLRRVVATSASREELEGLLLQAGVIDLIDDEATASDAERSKPDPDIIQAAIARAELPPRELVMLGDTPYDVDAARKAGVRVIAFRTGGWKDADLEGAAAICVACNHDVVVAHVAERREHTRKPLLMLPRNVVIEKRLTHLALLSLLGIALVLYADFRSARVVGFIMATLPFALVGGVLGVVGTGGVVSLGSLVGFVTVLGIAARNGIMLVSHFRHLEREEGLTFGEALIVRGSIERVVPILMTALATGLALVPLVISGNRPGNEIEHPMAVVILGGLVTSTVLNLLVVPALYLRLGRSTGEVKS